MTHVYLYVDELQYELEGSMFHGSGMGVLRAFAQSPILTASMIPESFICIYYLERRTRDSRVIKYFNNNEIFHPILAVLYVGHVLIQMDSSPLNLTIFIDDGPFWVFGEHFLRDVRLSLNRNFVCNAFQPIQTKCVSIHSNGNDADS